jgi:protein-S-isoprenylcysteine O-methyltransferase Ste14
MYTGLDHVAFSTREVSRLLHIPPFVGAAAILAGAAIAAWALVVFDSWRILAKLEPDHRLCTRGPYRFVRNPIYLACDLLAIGSFLWVPTWETLAGVFLMHLGGELRARTEERLLDSAFGEEYRGYRERTGRFLPLFGSLRLGKN